MGCPTVNKCGTFSFNDRACDAQCFPVCSSIPDVQERSQLVIDRKKNRLTEMPPGQTLTQGQSHPQFRSITAYDFDRIRSINWTAFMGNDGICRDAAANNPNAASAWFLFKKRPAQPAPSDAPPAASSPLSEKADDLKKGADKLTEDARNGFQKMVDRLGTPAAVIIVAAAVTLGAIALVAAARGAARISGWVKGWFSSKSKSDAEKPKAIETPPASKTPEPDRKAILPPSRIPSSPVSMRPSVDPLRAGPETVRSAVGVIVAKDHVEDTPVAWDRRPSEKLSETLRRIYEGENSRILKGYEEKYGVRISKSALKVVGFLADIFYREANDTLSDAIQKVLDRSAEIAGKRRKAFSDPVDMKMDDVLDAMETLKVPSFTRASANTIIASNAPWFASDDFEFREGDSVLREARQFLDANYRDRISEENRARLAMQISQGVEMSDELAQIYREKGGRISDDLVSLAARFYAASANGGMLETMRTDGTSDTLRTAQNESAQKEERLKGERETVVERRGKK